MRFLKLILCIVLLTFLCGCKYGADYVEPEERYIVTGLGFEKNSNGLLSLVEVSNINQEIENVFYGFGSDANLSVTDALENIPGNVILSQCPVILVGDSVVGENLKTIFDFCVSDYELSLSTLVVGCQNVADIFSLEENIESVGHTVIKTINNAKKEESIGKLSRLSNVYISQTKNGDFKIPYIKKGNNNLVIDYLLLYKNFEKAEEIILKGNESIE